LLTFKKLVAEFALPTFYLRKKRLLDSQPRLRTWVIIGPMESGKTTFVKTVLYWQNRALEKHGISYRNVQFFDVRSVLKGLVTNWKATVLNIFVDDAVFLVDSRAAMTKENQLLTQVYFYIRHYVEHYSRQTRLINVFWSAQSPTSIDKRIRDTATVVVLKGMVRGGEEALRNYFPGYVLRRMALVQILSTIDDRYKSYAAVSLQKSYARIIRYDPEPRAEFEEYGERPESKLAKLFKAKGRADGGSEEE
jgi:hypothetical protein